MKKSIKYIAVLAIIALSATALVYMSRKPVNEFETFFGDFNLLTDDIIKTIRANPTAAGVKEAQKILDSRKDNLRTRIANLKTARGSQLDEEQAARFRDNMNDNKYKMNQLILAYKNTIKSDREFEEGIKKILIDYTSLLE